MRRHLIPALSFATVMVSTAVAGCAPGLAANPRFATNADAHPQGAGASAKPVQGPAPISAPKKDLTWHDCTGQVFGSASIPPVPNVTLECANFDSSLDSLNGASGTVSIGVVRARTSATPADAGPIVLTTGTDLPTSQQLPVWLTRSGTELLKSHPIVAVDRRGMGMSSPISCRETSDRQTMLDQAQFETGDDPVANLAAPGTQVQTGEQQSRGVEADLIWQPSPGLSFLASYAHVVATVTRDTTLPRELREIVATRIRRDFREPA